MACVGVQILMRDANSEAGPELCEGCVCGFEVKVEGGENSCTDGELHNGLRLKLLFCHVEEACGWEPKVCGEVAV